MRVFRLARIDDFQSIIIDNEAIPELNRDRARMIERDAADNFWIERIVKTDDHQLAIGRNVSVSPRDRDVVCSHQSSFGIERPIWISIGIKLPLQIVVQWIAVQQRRRVNQN